MRTICLNLLTPFDCRKASREVTAGESPPSTSTFSPSGVWIRMESPWPTSMNVTVRRGFAWLSWKERPGAKAEPARKSAANSAVSSLLWMRCTVFRRRAYRFPLSVVQLPARSLLTANTVLIRIKAMRVWGEHLEPFPGYVLAVQIRWRRWNAEIRIRRITVLFRGRVGSLRASSCGWRRSSWLW